MDRASMRAGYAPSSRGFTFVESLVVLLIVALLALVGVPGARDIVERSRATQQLLELRHLLEMARHTAIQDQVDVTVCGTSDGRQCSTAWRAQPTLLFVDRNANRSLDSNERLLALSRLTDTGAIDWRGSNGRRYVRFRPSGGVKEFGTFVYCPLNRDLRHARALVLSATGRPRATTDSNGDGIVEDAYGAPLQCPP